MKTFHLLLVLAVATLAACGGDSYGIGGSTPLGSFALALLIAAAGVWQGWRGLHLHRS